MDTSSTYQERSAYGTAGLLVVFLFLLLLFGEYSFVAGQDYSDEYSTSSYIHGFIKKLLPFGFDEGNSAGNTLVRFLIGQEKADLWLSSAQYDGDITKTILLLFHDGPILLLVTGLCLGFFYLFRVLYSKIVSAFHLKESPGYHNWLRFAFGIERDMVFFRYPAFSDKIRSFSFTAMLLVGFALINLAKDWMENPAWPLALMNADGQNAFLSYVTNADTPFMPHRLYEYWAAPMLTLFLGYWLTYPKTKKTSVGLLEEKINKEMPVLLLADYLTKKSEADYRRYKEISNHNANEVAGNLQTQESKKLPSYTKLCPDMPKLASAGVVNHASLELSYPGSDLHDTNERLQQLYDILGIHDLYPSQVEFLHHFKSGSDIILQTGRYTGKTTVLMMAALENLLSGGRMLIACPDKEAVDDLMLKFSRVFSDAAWTDLCIYITTSNNFIRSSDQIRLPDIMIMTFDEQDELISSLSKSAGRFLDNNKIDSSSLQSLSAVHDYLKDVSTMCLYALDRWNGISRLKSVLDILDRHGLNLSNTNADVRSSNHHTSSDVSFRRGMNVVVIALPQTAYPSEPAPKPPSGHRNTLEDYLDHFGQITNHNAKDMIKITMQVRHAEPGQLFTVETVVLEDSITPPWMRHGVEAWLLAGLLKFGKFPIIYFDGHPYRHEDLENRPASDARDANRRRRIELLMNTREICLEYYHTYIERMEEKVLFSKDASTNNLQKHAKAIVFPTGKENEDTRIALQDLERLESLRISLSTPSVPVFILGKRPETWSTEIEDSASDQEKEIDNPASDGQLSVESTPIEKTEEASQDTSAATEISETSVVLKTAGSDDDEPTA